MFADLAIAQPPFAERRAVSLWTYAFVVFVVLMAVNAFYSQFAHPPPADLAAGQPSARSNPVYVGLWFLVYGISMLVLTRDVIRQGISLRLLTLVPFAAYIFVSALWANTPRSSLTFGLMFDLNIVIAAALAAAVPPRVLISVTGWTMVALATVSLVLLIVAPDTVVSTPDRPGLLMSGELFGVFAHKALLGLYASVGLLALIFVDRSRWRWRAGGIAILVAALLLSNSVSALAGLVAAALVLMAANRVGPQRNLVIGGAAAMAIVLSAVLPFIDLSWLTEAMNRGATLTGRGDFWKLTLGFIAERPIFGYGYHSFFDATPFSQVWALRGTENFFFTPNFHNSVLDTTIGLGLIGTVGYIAILAAASRVFANNTMDERVSGALAATLILLTLSSAVDYRFMEHNSLPTILLFYAFLVAGRDYGGRGTRLARSLSASGPERASFHNLSRRQLEQATGRDVLASLPTLPPIAFAEDDSVPANARDVDRAVNLLLTRLRSRGHGQGGGPLAVVVTSGDDQRSKSALSLYLALCATLLRQKVLLVDADPRGAVTAAACGGRTSKPDAATETIGGHAVSHVDSFPGLRVISPVDGLEVEKLAAVRFLEEIEGSDLVVIDAPLLGSDLVAERLIADNRIGSIVLTASAQRSTFGAVRRAVAPLADDQRLMPVLCDWEEI